MKSTYRVLNGMKAAGVRKKFSAEEIQLRTERLVEARLARLKKIEAQKNAAVAEKALVKQMAELGIFVPIGARLVSAPEISTDGNGVSVIPPSPL